jgi:hypothetical protein
MKCEKLVFVFGVHGVDDLMHGIERRVQDRNADDTKHVMAIQLQHSGFQL